MSNRLIRLIAQVPASVHAKLITAFLTLGMRQHAMVPGRWQSMVELSYEFIAKMVRDNVGNDGMRYFPFVFTLFMFILFCNLIGMVPFTFTVTSHIIVTFVMAAVVFLGVTVIGATEYGARSAAGATTARRLP